jgi:hypothetical protein
MLSTTRAVEQTQPRRAIDEPSDRKHRPEQRRKQAGQQQAVEKRQMAITPADRMP